MAGAAETMAAVMCQSSHPGHTGILERTESLDLKKKKKKAVPLERARWRESIKMTPTRLHPREHPVGPKCVSSQIDACPSGLRFADWQTPLHTRFGRHSIHAPSGPGLGESMQALVLTVL